MKFLKSIFGKVRGSFGKIFNCNIVKSGYFWVCVLGLGFYFFKYYRANLFIGTHGKSAEGQGLTKNIIQVFGYWIAEKYSALRDLFAIITGKKDASRVRYDADTNATSDRIKEFFGVYPKGAYTNG